MEWVAPSGASFVGVSCFKNTSVASQTVANNTAAAVTFNDEDFDTDGFHSTTTNTSRCTIPTGKGGYYLITGCISYDTNNTGNRGLYFYKNGVNIRTIAQVLSIANWATNFSASTIVNLVAGDYIEMFAYQNSGGNLDVLRETTNTRLQLQFLGA